MDQPSYSTASEYLTLVATVRTTPTDETARLVLADWVQEHGDEAEAVAIRAGRSFTVDLIPHLRACVTQINEALTVIAQTLCDAWRAPELAEVPPGDRT